MRVSGADLTLERRLGEPREVEEVRVYPNPQAIRARYGDKIGEVIRAIQSAGPSLVEALERDGRAVVGGFEVTRDMVFVKRERRKVYVERFVPHVVEPSFGLERIVYVVLEHNYVELDGRLVLRLPPDVAPITVAVLPIVDREPLTSMGRELVARLWREGIWAVYDDDGSIGARYAKYDELGTPLAVTIDEQSERDGTVTVRDRDTRRQVRIGGGDVARFAKLVLSGKSFDEAAEELGAAWFRR